MKNTSHYNLNQWDAEDRILRENFNSDNVKIDDALAAEQSARETAVAEAKKEAADNLAAEKAFRESAVSAEATARANAISAEQSARESAISAEQSARESADSTERSAREAADTMLTNSKADVSTVTALSNKVDGLPFVKLKEVTTTADTTQVDVDMSDIDLRQYAYVLIVPQLTCTDDWLYVRVNGQSSNIYMVGDTLKPNLNQICSTSGGVGLLRLLGTNGRISTMYHYVQNTGVGGTFYGQVFIAYVTPDTFQTLNFVGIKSGTISAGGTLTFYGVKL